MKDKNLNYSVFSVLKLHVVVVVHRARIIIIPFAFFVCSVLNGNNFSGDGMSVTMSSRVEGNHPRRALLSHHPLFPLWEHQPHIRSVPNTTNITIFLSLYFYKLLQTTTKTNLCSSSSRSITTTTDLPITHHLCYSFSVQHEILKWNLQT